MTSTSHRRRRSRRFGVGRRFVAALVAAVLAGAAALTGAQPAAAAAPWLTVSDGFASFRIPAADVQNTIGTVSSLPATPGPR
jgi:hypothetical protein